MVTDEVEDETANELPEKPSGYDDIRMSLGEDRKRMLLELAKADGTLTARKLQQEDYADIKSGSMYANIMWLQGKDVRGNDLSEWPEGAEPLIETVGRVPTPGGGHPTRKLRLTDAGVKFAVNLREDSKSEPQEDETDVKTVLQSHEQRIRELKTEVERVNDRLDEINTDQQEPEDLEELKGRVKNNETELRAIFDQMSKYDEALGWGK